MLNPEYTIVTPLHSFDENILKTAKSIISAYKSSKCLKIQWIIKSSKEIRSSSRSALKELCENKIDINFYEKKDKNMYEGLIDAIDYVSTDYVIWLNSGDLLFDESFFNLSKSIEDSKLSIDIFIFNKAVKFLDNTIYHSKRRYFKKLIISGFYGYYGESLPQENIVFRKSLFQKLDLETLSKFKLAGDWFIFKEIFRIANEIKHVNRRFAMFVYCDGQLSSNKEGYKNEIKKFYNFQDVFFFYLFAWFEKFLGRL